MSKELMVVAKTTKTILGKQDKHTIARVMNGITKEKALADNTMPSMSMLCRQYKPELIEKIVAMMIQDASVFVGKKMSPADALDTAIEIMNTYPYRSLKLEEVYLICQEIKESDINRSQLTPNMVIRAVKKFWKDREKRAMQQSINESQNHKADTGIDERARNSVRTADSINDSLARIRADINKNYLK